MITYHQLTTKLLIKQHDFVSGKGLTDQVMKTYGKWIPDTRVKRGYQPINNWGHFIEPINPRGTLQMEDDELSSLISNTYMVEAAGIEPASANPLP